MASSDDLSDQLSMMTKLNSVVERMAKSVAAIEGSYETQINTIEKLTLAVNSINVENSVTELNKINLSLKQIIEGLGKFSSASDQTMGKMVSQSSKAQQAVSALTGGVAAATAAILSSSKNGGKGMSGLGDEVAKTATEMNKFDDSANKVSKSLIGKVAKSSVVAAAAIGGFRQGIKNVVALSKGALGFTTSLVSGLGQITASILAIPLKIFTGLVDMAASAAGGSNELLIALENLRKEMGNLNKSGSQAVLKTTKTMQGFSDTGLSTWKVFGTLAETLQLVTKVAVTMGATFGTLKDEFVANGGAILGFQKGLGITDEQMKSVGDRAITMGTSMSKLLLDVTKQTLELGDAFDIDQKLIGKDMSKAIVDVKHFGSATVKEIGQASVYARKLGLELDKIVGTLDQFESFDSAAESAAKLSQSFGVTVDAFKLMEAQSPAEQLDMLRKSFKDAGVDSSNFSRQQLKLLSSTTGLDEATAKQAFSLNNQGTSLDKIKAKSEKAEKKTLSQAEAMSKLADSIERLVKDGPALSGSFFDMFVKGFLRGIQSTKEFQQMIMFIKRDLALAMRAGVELGRTFEKVFPGVKDFFGGIRDFFDPKRFTVLLAGVNAAFTKFFKDVSTGKFSFKSLMEELQKTFFNFFDTSEGSGQRVLKGFTDFFKSLAKIVGQAIPWVAEQLGKGLQTIADFLKDPSKALNAAKKGGAGAAGFAGQVLMPIIEGLRNAWKNPEFQHGLHDFIDVTGTRLKQLFESPTFKKAAHGIIGAMLTSLLAPTVVSGVLGGVLTKVGGGIVKQIGAAVFKKGGAGVAEKVGAQGVAKLAGAAGPAALIAAAAAIGKGVNTYTDQITSTMDHSSKVIAAGAAGMIDALTLGLLPDDLMTTLANVFATISDTLFKAMGSVFGTGFANTLKRRLSAMFEVFGNIYSLIANLFTGDQASVSSSAAELGLSVLRFIISALEMTFIQIPIFLGRMASKIIVLVGEVVTKIMFAQAALITKSIDAIAGTHLTETLNKASDEATKGLSKAGDSINEAMLSVSEKISKSSGDLQDKYLRTAEDQARIAKSAAVSAGATQAAGVAEANKKVEQSLSKSLEDIQSAKEIKKELDSGFDLKSTITHIKETLTGIDFKILTEDQMSDLTKAADLSDTIRGAVDKVSGAFDSLSRIPATIKSATSALKGDALKPALDAVSNMVKLVNQLDSALSDGNLNKVDVRAKLTNVANSVGLGAKSSYTITNKAVNITVNLTVTMNADDLEKALVMRASSIIRDRLNFATGEGAGRRGTPQIPETATPNLQKISTAD